eukprot:Rhum_TRINITY_DN14601_c15_g1::Rhum_TRINITY_DN14601_c15_g1_i1::g.104900::m.104900
MYVCVGVWVCVGVHESVRENRRGWDTSRKQSVSNAVLRILLVSVERADMAGEAQGLHLVICVRLEQVPELTPQRHRARLVRGLRPQGEAVGLGPRLHGDAAHVLRVRKLLADQLQGQDDPQHVQVGALPAGRRPHLPLATLRAHRVLPGRLHAVPEEVVRRALGDRRGRLDVVEHAPKRLHVVDREDLLQRILPVVRRRRRRVDRRRRPVPKRPRREQVVLPARRRRPHRDPPRRCVDVLVRVRPPPRRRLDRLARTLGRHAARRGRRRCVPARLPLHAGRPERSRRRVQRPRLQAARRVRPLQRRRGARRGGGRRLLRLHALRREGGCACREGGGAAQASAEGLALLQADGDVGRVCGEGGGGGQRGQVRRRGRRAGRGGGLCLGVLGGRGGGSGGGGGRDGGRVRRG